MAKKKTPDIKYEYDLTNESRLEMKVRDLEKSLKEKDEKIKNLEVRVLMKDEMIQDQRKRIAHYRAFFDTIKNTIEAFEGGES